jgi:hypothetical protein
VLLNLALKSTKPSSGQINGLRNGRRIVLWPSTILTRIFH